MQGNDGNFYGTTVGGPAFPTDWGSVFKITPQGTLTTLYRFTGGIDGEYPLGGLVQGKDGNFYGTTSGPSSAGPWGNVFLITPLGTLTNLYTFNDDNDDTDGGNPSAAMIQGSDGNFYGTTTTGGDGGGEGTVFRLNVGAEPVCGASINPPEAVYGSAGGSASVSVTASNGCAWRATSNVGFITITSGNSGSGNGTVGYTVNANTGDTPLTGTMTIAGQTFTVTQSGGSVENNAQVLVQANPTDGGTVRGGGTFTVGSSQQISASANSGWTFSSWNDGGAQIHNITVPPGGAIYTANFTAQPCTFKLSTESISLTAKGGSKSISVKASGSDCSWIAASNDSFITITGSSGTTVKFTVPGNTNTVPLTGTMTIAGQTFTVNQAAGGCTYKLSPKSGKLKATGGLAKVRVTPNLTDCAWTAVSNDPFITIVSSASGMGRGAISYSVAANTSTNVLKGTITIGGQTFSVTQTGAK